MPLYEISSLAAILVQAPVCPSVLFDRGLGTYLAHAEAYRGICRDSKSPSRNPIYLAELPGLPHSDRFLLSADGLTFIRPRVSGVDARTEPRGPLVREQNLVLRVLHALFPGDRKAASTRQKSNEGYRLILFDGSGVVLTFERGLPCLWRNVQGNADPFDSELYYPGLAPADNLLAAGFSAFPPAETHRMLTSPKARFLR